MESPDKIARRNIEERDKRLRDKTEKKTPTTPKKSNPKK